MVENLKNLKNIRVVSGSSYLCLLCKAGRMLCGKSQCPILLKLGVMLKHKKIFDLDVVEGSSPPSVFVGRFGYPKVFVGPLIPPVYGDTSIYDLPENWVGLSIDEILNFRFSLVWGRFSTKIDEVRKGGKLLELLQELAMSITPVDGEAELAKTPVGTVVFDSHSQPFGPSAPLKNFRTTTIKVEKNIEKCFYDYDLKANEAILKLYQSKVPVSKIQLSLSLGILGKLKTRKIVPTRWSITAVDNAISLNLINEIKHYDTISEYRVYIFKNLDNLFVAIFMPGSWSFEWIEAWFPGTVWNLNGKTPELMGDFEDFYGRKTYADVGGCYYAARLAVSEALKTEHKQATVLVFREIYSGYTLPIGVWNVRESLRKALKTKPQTFPTFQEALKFVSSKLKIPIKEWVKKSFLLKKALLQKKLTEFIQ